MLVLEKERLRHKLLLQVHNNDNERTNNTKVCDDGDEYALITRYVSCNPSTSDDIEDDVANAKMASHMLWNGSISY